MSHRPPPPSDPRPGDGGRADAGPPRDDRPSAPGSAPGIDPVDAEWTRIEEERVADEVAEAREDAIEAIESPFDRRRTWRWMWWAFAAALVSGVVFAGWIDLVVAMNRPAPEPLPLPSAPGGPSPSELGQDTGEDDPADEPAPAATPETGKTDQP
mgnify:CR=1 FL=1